MKTGDKMTFTLMPDGVVLMRKREADKSEPALFSLPVLLETEWVLRSRYELSKPLAGFVPVSGAI